MTQSSGHCALAKIGSSKITVTTSAAWLELNSGVEDKQMLLGDTSRIWADREMVGPKIQVSSRYL